MLDDKISLKNIIFDSKKSPYDIFKIFKGARFVKKIENNEQHSLKELFESTAQKKPYNIFLIDKKRKITYKEFNEKTNQLANYFSQYKNIKKNDIVSIYSKNSIEYLICFFSLIKLGAKIYLINTSLKNESLKNVFQISQSKFNIISLDLISSFKQTFKDSKDFLTFYIENEMFFEKKQNTYDIIENIPPLIENFNYKKLSNENLNTQSLLDEEIFYIFTSGSTGMPKAASVANRRWCMAFGGGLSLARFNEKDILYNCLPFYHANAMIISLSAVIASKCSMAIAEKFSRTHFWDDVTFYQATSFNYIGEICRYLLSNEISNTERKHNVKKIIGNGMQIEIWEKFQKRFNIPYICEFYAASESNISFTNILYLKNTVGLTILPYEIIKYDHEKEEPIKNKEGYLIKAKKGEIGLLISPKNKIFSGYSDSKKNKEIILKNVFKHGDEWINSGDLMRYIGYGHVQFCDRAGDTYRWKGENTSAIEIEKHLNSIAGVEKSAVYGVKIPQYDGKAGMASLIVDNKNWNMSDFYKEAKQKIPSYSMPIFIRIVSNFELTETYKIKKHNLKKMSYDKNTEQVYYLDSKNETYSPLNKENLLKIYKKTIKI